MKKEKTMEGFSLTTGEISRYLEVTPPFLMIDYVDEIKPGKSALGVKNLTDDDWFFKCHMRREPTMPGALQIEAMLQTLVLTIYTMKGHEGMPVFQVSVKAKLVSKIYPGNQLIIQANLLSYKRGIAKGAAVGKVNDATVCQGEFTFASPHDMPRPQG
jgi:3-hydroxyacyl-[acyl-carrier-protein] dehydratase